MFTFKELQDEVKRRATLNQSGTQFDTAVKNVVNLSIRTIANLRLWRSLRRRDKFQTVASFSTGTASVSVGATSVTFVGANLITNNVQIGRRIKFSGSSTLFDITAITGENAATINLNYDGSEALSGGTFTILGQGMYNLPIQTSRPAILWHEAFDYVYPIEYVTDRAFMDSNIDLDDDQEPLIYRMWGEDWVINQPRTAGLINCVSSSTADTAAEVTIFGVVSGYPDSEKISLNGTTTVPTAKSFTSIERITKDSSTTGRVTVTSDSGNTSIAVLPAGNTTTGIQYKKIELFPYPDDVYQINVQYYKEPYKLVNDDDIHEIGSDFDNAIILLSTATLNGEQSKDKNVANFYSLYEKEIQMLTRKNVDKLDWLPRLQRWGDGQRSRAHGPHKSLSYMQLGSKFGPSSRY